MSLEQAIIEHAAAIRELAAALTARNSSPDVVAQQAAASIKSIESAVTGDVAAQPDDLEDAVSKVEADAKNVASGAASTAGTKVGAQSDAKAKAIAEAKAAAAAAQADKETVDEGEPLDYMKDVAPALNKAAQKNRQGVIDLLASLGAKKGNEVKPADYRALLDGAENILAA